MKPENQLTSLYPSKRLKELGFKQESLFYWEYVIFEQEEPYWKISFGNRKGESNPLSAYTISELGEFLKPEIINKYLSDFCIENGVQERNWRIIFDVDFWANFIIYLKENNLI